MDKTKESIEIFIPDTWKEKTLSEARKFIDEKKEAGTQCPCCGQLCKVYYRRFNRNMALFLISLAKKSTEDKKWVHYKNCRYSARDYAAIAYWGLAVMRKGDGEAKKNSGYWLPTRSGIDFINGKIRIPSHVIIFNNKIDWGRGGFSSTQIKVEDALGKDFSFEELMGARKVVRAWEVLSDKPRTLDVLLEENRSAQEENYAKNSRAPTPSTPVKGS